jgi:hypothetical protein
MGGSPPGLPLSQKRPETLGTPVQQDGPLEGAGWRVPNCGSFTGLATGSAVLLHVDTCCVPLRRHGMSNRLS